MARPSPPGRRILALATAGLRPDQRADVEHRRYPRVDYIELQRLLDLDVLDYSAYQRTAWGPALRWLDTRLRSDLYLALLGLAAQRRYRMVFAMSERAGIPCAGLRRLLPSRTPLVSMFACWSTRQERTITRLRLFAAMDRIVVKSRALRDHFIALGAPSQRIHLIPYAVDQRFFSPRADVEQDSALVLTVGEVRTRDYAALFQAVDGLPVQVLAAASGSWYARERMPQLAAIGVPSNVTLAGKLSLAELRTLYARSQFVVLPLHDALFSAGATSLLEAMCMGRCAVVTGSRGILDYVVDGETGLVVAPGDASALRAAIAHLLAHPAEARRMGCNARQRIENELNLDAYVARIARVLTGLETAQ